MQAAEFAKIFPDVYHQKFVENECRIDGRNFTTVRQTIVEVHPLATADGSALARIGNTSVLCGIKLEVGLPPTSKPSDGKIIISVNTPAACSALSAQKIIPATSADNIGSQPSSLTAANSAMAQFLERIVLDSKILDLSQLGILEGVASWYVYVDIVCLNNDGNLLDAAVLALSNALLDVTLPQTYTPDDKLVYTTDGPRKHLVLGTSLYPLTCAKYRDVIIVDPSLEEEKHSSGLLTVVFNDAGKLCSFYKPGGTPISLDCMTKILQMTAKRSGSLHRTKQAQVGSALSLPISDIAIQANPLK